MLILALDTCLNQCAVCLYDAGTGEVIAQNCEIMERGHAEALTPMVRDVLSDQKPQRIVVTTGPGSFTGVRIGLSFARAYGLALNIPVLGLDTLQALRLSRPTHKTIALISGQSGLAFVNSADRAEIYLQPLAEVAAENLVSENVNLKLLAAWAATQTPRAFPEPVYIRQADAKPPAIIKQVTAEHLHVLATMHKECFQNAWSEQEFNDLLSTTGTTALIAEVANEPAAFALFRNIMDENEILTIATIPNRRKLGLAQKLLLEITKSALGQKTFLEVASDNIAAQKLYAKNGFSEIGRRIAYYSSGADAIVMQLNKR